MIVWKFSDCLIYFIFFNKIFPKIWSDWKTSSTSSIFLFDAWCNDYQTFAFATWLALLPNWNCLQIRCKKNRRTVCHVTFNKHSTRNRKIPNFLFSACQTMTKNVRYYDLHTYFWFFNKTMFKMFYLIISELSNESPLMQK